KPFKSLKYDDLFREKADEDSTEKNIEINIRRQGLLKRIKQIGPRFGSQSGPYVIQKDDKTIVLYSSNHNEGKRKLWKTTFEPFKNPETEAFKKIGSTSNIVQIDNNIWALYRGSIYKLNVNGASAEKINISYSFDRNLKDEFAQMFSEIWANIEENYYNETLNNVDWKEIRKRYANYLPHATSRTEFQRLIIDMLGELNSSHVGFTTFGPEEKIFYSTSTLAVGLLFKKDEPYVVQRVIKESPASLSKHSI